jgi:single stranded DNA-binding protein
MSTLSIVLTGYVSREPELRRTQSGKAVVSVSVPHQRSRKLEGGGYENVGETTWVEATFWEKDAEAIAASVHKGTQVTIVGQLETEAYESNGEQRRKLVVTFPTLAVVVRGSRPEGGQQSAPRQQQAQEPEPGGWFQPTDADAPPPWS